MLHACGQLCRNVGGAFLLEQMFCKNWPFCLTKLTMSQEKPTLNMRINLRQEIALWVLGLLWTALGFGALINASELSAVLKACVSCPVFLHY